MSDDLPVYDPNEPARFQQHDWDCAEESCHWMLAAYGRTPDEQWLESSLVAAGVIDPAVGLTDATGAGLARWLNLEYGGPEYGYVASNDGEVSFDDVAAEAATERHPLMIGGRNWYHWSGVRSYDPVADVLELANPAPGYYEVYQIMGREQFAALGPFSLVRLTHPATESTVPPQPTSTLEGIDTSSHQGSVDYAAVARSGVSFVFTKASESIDYVNPYFRDAWAAIKAAGLLRGAYHYARPEYGNSAADEAWLFMATLGELQPGDSVILDLEPSSPVAGVAEWALAWLREVEDVLGVRPWIYTGRWVIDQQGLAGASELATYPLWLAAYQSSAPPPPQPWSEIVCWQYTDAGSVSGVSTPCDRDRFYGSRDELAAYGKGGGMPDEDPYQPWIDGGLVGSGLIDMMRADGTLPAQQASTWLPLGAVPADIEECLGQNGTMYRWTVSTTNQGFRYRPE